jgi:demethylmenaquinone methyltransferase / 2-methoxy-6-polyprenyl-1,4-benzoquinol methylase
MHDPPARARSAPDGALASEHSTRGGSRSSPAEQAPIPILPGYYGDEKGRKRFVRELFDRSAPDYEDVERIAGLGAGEWYRGEALKRCGLRAGMQVLDVAAGTGLTARAAVSVIGDARNVVALDPSREMLREASRTGGISLVQATGERLPCRSGAFDFLSMGYALRHLSDLHLAFGEFLRVLKPAGTVCLLEIHRPESRLAAGLLKTYIRTLVPRLAQLLKGRSRAEPLMHFYWDTIEACAPPSTIMAVLSEAGFERVERFTRWGIFSEYVGRKPA